MGRMPAEFQNLPGGPSHFYDFFDFKEDIEVATTRWTWNVTNSTAPTTVNDAEFGTVTMTNAGADNDRIEASRIAEGFSLNVLAKTLWFISRFKLSDVTDCDAGVGLVITDADWLGDSAVASDGIWFEKNDNDAYLDLVYARNATTTADYARFAALATLTADTFVTVAFRVITDPNTLGTGTVTPYVNGVAVGGQNYTINTPYDEILPLAMGLQNGAAAAKTMTVDYIGAIIER